MAALAAWVVCLPQWYFRKEKDWSGKAGPRAALDAAGSRARFRGRNGTTGGRLTMRMFLITVILLVMPLGAAAQERVEAIANGPDGQQTTRPIDVS